ncbi:MAG TPA: mechanosensitive ion channel family protein [Candidatus Saccharimonadales bacterium]|nr:mechanosensitive ion channel family protein [Candidatus Saccharimonadales bacterium]
MLFHPELTYFASNSPINLNQTTNTLKSVSNSVFNVRSLTYLIVALVVGDLVGKILSRFLRSLSILFGRRADKSNDIARVNKYRRIETLLILSTALVELVVVVFALYFWWIIIHPNQQPTALVGASALILLLASGILGPILRDLAFGGSMMAEQWFGVGDLITILPFPEVQGVVERVTLRSTKIRGLNGEVVWMANQNIQGVQVAFKGVHSMAIELFVDNVPDAEKLINRTNELLPQGTSLVVSPLTIVKEVPLPSGGVHATALAETAPGREWLIEKHAIEIITNLDEESDPHVLLTPPVARYADNETERKFSRAISNAKKPYVRKRRLKLPIDKQ